MKNLIEELRQMAEHKREYLADGEKYSTEFRDKKRAEIKTLEEVCEILERLDYLGKAIRNLFNL